MRTTFDIPAALLDEARAAVGYTSKTDTVILALRQLVRQHRLDELKALIGRVHLDVDLAESRRRRGRPPKARA